MEARLTAVPLAAAELSEQRQRDRVGVPARAHQLARTRQRAHVRLGLRDLVLVRAGQRLHQEAAGRGDLPGLAEIDADPDGAADLLALFEVVREIHADAAGLQLHDAGVGLAAVLREAHHAERAAADAAATSRCPPFGGGSASGRET